MEKIFPSFLKPKYVKSLSQAQAYVQVFGPYIHLIIALVYLTNQTFGIFLNCQQHDDFNLSHINVACSNQELLSLNETDKKPAVNGPTFQYYRYMNSILQLVS